MAWTQSEVEAKLAALEERIEVVMQAADTLEKRSFLRFQQWDHWAAELGDEVGRLNKQLDRVRLRLVSRT